MSLRWKLVLPIGASLLLSSLCGFALLQSTLVSLVDDQARQTRSMIDDQIRQEMQGASEQFGASIQEHSRTARKLASMICLEPWVLDAYAVAQSGNINDEADPRVQEARQALRAGLAPILAGYKAESGDETLQMHFHLSNARSLVRSWRNGWNAKKDGKQLDISDDLSGFREGVVKLNSGGVDAIVGIEVGNAGFAMRGIVPIKGQQGRRVGSLEVIYPFATTIHELEGHADAGLAVYMDAKYLGIATDLQDPKKFPRVHDRFVRCAITQSERLEPLIDLDLLNEGIERLTVRRTKGMALGAWPIHDYGGKPVGVIVLTKDTSQQEALLAVQQDAGSQRATRVVVSLAIGATVGTVVLSSVAFVVVSRIVRRPLHQVIDRLRDIAEGDGDLTRRLTINTRDEIGELSEWFNTFVARIHDMMLRVRSDAQEVTSGAVQIAATSEQMSASISVQSQQVAMITNSIQAMTTGVAEASQRCQQTSHDAGSAGVMAQRGSEVVTRTIHDMQNTRNVVSAAASSITQLGQRAKQIGEIVEVINDIADQTNLLALNAAIEAARAGDYGRGFAVVADEVRDLADNTTAATEKIAQQIASIQNEIGGAIKQMEAGTHHVEQSVALAREAGAALGDILSASGKVAERIGSVAHGAEDQASQAGQIADSIAEINSMIAQASEGSAQAAKAATHLSAKADSLMTLVQTFKLADHAEGRSRDTTAAR